MHTQGKNKEVPTAREPVMASNSKIRHRQCNKDNKRPKSKRASSTTNEQLAAGPTSLHDVPDHLLELILLRLRSPACLLRAAAACKRWRRVITGAGGFLSRCLHAPSFVAGHYHAFDPDWVDYDSPPITGNPVFIPSPSRAVVDATRFSLDLGGFLPDSDSGWTLADSRGSLLLFKRRTGWAAHANTRDFPDVVVCEPLTRQCQGILRPHEHATCLGVFLLDGDRADDASGGRRIGIGMSDFRILAVLHEYHESEEGRAMPAACVFSLGSDDGGWRVLPTAFTNSAAVSLPGAMKRVSFSGRANGSLYWVIGGEEDDGPSMLVFDEAAMVFSRVPLPTDDDVDDNGGGLLSLHDRWSFRVIGSGEGGGALRVVRLVRNELRVLTRRRGSNDDADEWLWVVQRLVRLREATLGLPGRSERFFMRNAMIMAAHEGYVLITPQEKTWLFSIELETMRVERDHERNRYAGQAYPSELPWPPSLMACTSGGRSRRRRSSCG
jgi:hypothetical protein